MMQFLKRMYQQQSARLMYRHGLAYEQKQSYQRAVEAFSEAIAKSCPSIAEAIVHRGVSRMQLQDTEGAIADFERVIQAEQTLESSQNFLLAQAHFYRGQLHQQSGDEAAALNHWAAAIAGCSTYSLPYYHRALVFLANGDHDCALASLNAAIEAYPLLPLAYFQRGNLRAQLGDKSGAIADLTCAIGNDFTLENAKEQLKHLQQDIEDAQLSQVLSGPLAKQKLSVKVHRQGDRLNIQIRRAAGVGINYYTLPATIREHLVPLQLDEVSQFQLISRVGEATHPDWNQAYRLYKDQPCPPSHWQSAVAAMIMFPPLAVPAFIQAAQVKSAYKKGRYVEALSASELVKVLGVASSLPFAFFWFLALSYGPYDFERKAPTLSTIEQPKVANQLDRKIEKH